MKPAIAKAALSELIARGYSLDGTAPNGTMDLSERYLVSVSLEQLFDQLVARREKIFRSIDVVGEDAAKKSYSDVTIAVDALKALIAQLELQVP